MKPLELIPYDPTQVASRLRMLDNLFLTSLILKNAKIVGDVKPSDTVALQPRDQKQTDQKQT
jgi:hypothetical protein